MRTSPIAMQAYYARDKERDRLGSGAGRVEFARTVEIVERTMPAGPVVVADVGGGPGRYTDWLVDAGHRVIHRDLVASHVDQVRQRHGERVDSAVGDARSLDLADDTADVTLLLGPLYHLSTVDDRVGALREAARITRPGGVVHAAAIARWAPRLDGLLTQELHTFYPVFLDVIEGMEATGHMPPIVESGFTGYAHTPSELEAEVDAAGLDVHSLVAVEGIAFTFADIDERMDDPARREHLLAMLRALESVPDLLGIGPHLLATALVP